MKLIKYLFAAAALSLAVASCSIHSEDAFSTAPVAPVLNDHSDILMTANTMSEDVEFTWQAARFISVTSYDFKVAYGSDTVSLQNNSSLSYKVSKTDFRDLLKNTFTLPENNTHEMSFFVSVTDSESGKVYNSAVRRIKVYSYGNSVSADPKAEVEEVKLNLDTPDEIIKLLSWEPARLIYGQTVRYNVAITTKTFGTASANDEPVPYPVAAGLLETSLSLGTDVINEAVIAAGGAEGDTVTVLFHLSAYCDSIPDGVSSSTNPSINIETYLATFPDTLYLPGSYQDWKPAIAPQIYESPVRKGYYEGVIDLTTSDGANALFKFSPKPAWEGDFGGVVELTTFGPNKEYTSAKGTIGASANIEVPSGFYNISLDKKKNTIYMVQIEKLSLIGEAFTSWNNDTDLIYDAATKTFSADVPADKFTAGKEFKIRTNHDWTHSIGAAEDKALTNVSYALGTNMLAPSKAGRYKVVLNCSKTPYTINFADMDMPETLVIAGDYSGREWSATDDPKIFLVDAGKGIYKGYITMYNPHYGFKVVKNGSDWIGGTLKSSVADTTIYDLSASGGNMNFSSAAQNGSYYWEVDMINMTAKMVKLDDAKMGLIGSFEGSGWGTVIPMTFDATHLTYSITRAFAANNEFKFKFSEDSDWRYEAGCLNGNDLSVLKHGASNYKITEAGTYTIVLNMASQTAGATITKQ